MPGYYNWLLYKIHLFSWIDGKQLPQTNLEMIIKAPFVLDDSPELNLVFLWVKVRFNKGNHLQKWWIADWRVSVPASELNIATSDWCIGSLAVHVSGCSQSKSQTRLPSLYLY